MPPKSKTQKAQKPKTDKTDKSQSDSDIDEESVKSEEDLIDYPALEYVSDHTKEKYQYNPQIRTEIIYRRPEDRRTSEVMTKFELCEVISIRAKQLEKSNKVFTDVGDITDPLEMAKKEIIDKKCPLSIVRMLTDKIAEKWHVNELAIPSDIL